MAANQVKSSATRRFWVLFQALPSVVWKLAVKNYRLWFEDPQHPSLHFRLLKGSHDRFTVRIGDHYRALAHMRSGTITWVWIGSHSDYDRLVGRE